ncbi:hypothetical protein LCGC14_1976660 [marine sediment metagenome]|uniref:Uncharacterized protein n=1 Tax=marine sediment metagenome TaxID=412755 RepID=A0A0F9HNK4_9ZZZZ
MNRSYFHCFHKNIDIKDFASLVGEFPYIVQVKQRGGGTIEPNDVLALLGRMK